MAPVVNGLAELYTDEVSFVELDAKHGGRDAYAAAGAPGHPAFLIVQPDGTEVWRGFGVLDLSVLDAALTAALGDSQQFSILCYS